MSYSSASLNKLSKKALFITSMPFYWFIFFKYVINWFEIGMFLFVVLASFAISMLGMNWGVLDSL
ncbi:hypothetical protein KY339_04620, partial [Candidatus Woesearchaeota archaeon]|nr:hypothetical protein [Candidatus Woesearchaeota archaeon]